MLLELIAIIFISLWKSSKTFVSFRNDAPFFREKRLYSPSRIMQICKSIFAIQVFKKFPELKEELWGGEFWSDGGHIDSVAAK